MAFAGDVNLRAQVGHFRIKGDFETRSLEFILVNQPSLVPYQDLPKGATAKPELFGELGFDYNFERIGLTVGPTVGVERPATFTPPAGQTLPAAITGNTGSVAGSTTATIVVRNEGDFSILPNKASEVPLVATKLELREDFLEYFAAIFQMYYQHDANQTHLTKASDGTSIRDFNHPDQLGFNITLQARY
jgi:hypothetical protein